MPSPPDATRPGDGCFVHEMPEFRVVFGAGTLDRVAGEAVLLGSSVLLIAGRRQGRAADRVAAALAERCAGRIDGVAEHVRPGSPTARSAGSDRPGPTRW